MSNVSQAIQATWRSLSQDLVSYFLRYLPAGNHASRWNGSHPVTRCSSCSSSDSESHPVSLADVANSIPHRALHFKILVSVVGKVETSTRTRVSDLHLMKRHLKVWGDSHAIRTTCRANIAHVYNGLLSQEPVTLTTCPAALVANPPPFTILNAIRTRQGIAITCSAIVAVAIAGD
jgi:hypothetical protein